LNGGLLVNNGTITGTTDVNYGSLAKGTGVYGVVNVNQGGMYAPGNSPGIVTAAAVNFDNTPVNSGAPVLQIELAGTTPGTGYDQLHVTGQLSLGGTLQVLLVNPSFTPAAGNSFDILDWGSLSGTFSSLSLPSLTAGLMWNASHLYTTGILSVTLAGDYNRNGIVDAADYTVWRDTLGSTTNLVADGNGSRTIDAGDYDVWKTNFGNHSGAGASANAAVPEPSTLWMVLSGILAICSCRRAAAS
jgi:PEP-CTERM motif-containing protein